MFKAVVVFEFAIFMAATAQTILKYAASRQYANWWQGYINPYVMCAYSLLFCSMLLSVWTYRVLPLSLGAVLVATVYFYAALFGRVFFGERLTRRKVMGLVLIAGGIGVYALVG